eukprot:XP_011681324.1 PREDICTED: ankyrin-1-like [Strongylocentrotus purpuratus]
MGVNTDGEEISSGSTVPAGVKQTETACEYDQQHEHGQSLTQDADWDEGIQDQKPAKGAGLPLITSLQNMPSQHTSGALNTGHNEAKRDHTDGGDRVLSNTPRLLRPDADIEDQKKKLSHGPLGNLNTNPYKEGYTPLYKAALEGHLEGVDDLIARGANVNKPSKGGLRPLHAAAQEGHAHIVDFLIMPGADVNVGCERGRTPLHTAAAKHDKGMIPLHGAAIPDDLKVMEYLIHIGSYLRKEDAKDSTPLNAAVQNGHIEALEYLITEGAKKNIYDGMTPLYAAAELGNLDVVKYFISKGAEVNEEDKRERIPLHGAATRGHIEVMDYLIQQGSDVNKKNNLKWTPFNAAVQYGHLEAVKVLMAKGAKQNRYSGMTPLFAAAQFGNLDIVKYFIFNGADVNEEDDKGMIPLHGAAIRGHFKVMEYLIQQGSDVNKCDAMGSTPLNAAVQNGHLETLKYLMAKGAKQNIYSGMTPLFAAAQSGHLDIVKFFISNGADVDEEDEDGMIPLHVAAARGHIEVMEYLIQQGSDVNKGDAKGWTPFNAAVQYGHLDAVKLLMAKGAKLTRLYGLTALYIATQYDHMDVVNFLVFNGYDVNERRDCGKAPLHAACYNGNMDIVKLLVHHKANVNEQDRDGWTPLEAAVQEGHQDIVDYLTLNGADMNVRDIDNLTPLQTASNTAHPHAIEGISTCRRDPNEEETGDPRSGGHQNLISRGKVTVSLKDADTQSRTGKLASQVDNADEGNDCIIADNANRGTDEPSLKSLPTSTNDDEKGRNEERNPFIHAKLKYPGKGEQNPMLDQIEAIESPVPGGRDTDCSYPRGPQTWQYSGFDSPYIQTMETDSHPSEGPESRCHSLIDENREMIESSSPMNVGNDLPINETSEIESFPTHPPVVVHQKLYDGNLVSIQGISSISVGKIWTKLRTAVYRCPSILVLLHTFLQMTIALAIILAGSPVLVAGSEITERVTLQAGKSGVVPFHLQWPPSDTFQGVPYFTLRFESKPRPFSNNGLPDIEGFKSPSQIPRFTSSVTDLDTSHCMNLMIDNVETLDEDRYILTTIWHSLKNVRYETIKKDVDVQIPPGPAKCFITLSENGDYPYEIHCRSATGSVTTTLSCYQNDRKLDVKSDITDNGLITKGNDGLLAIGLKTVGLKGDPTMGVNTDGEEMGPGSTATDGVEV